MMRPGDLVKLDARMYARATLKRGVTVHPRPIVGSTACFYAHAEDLFLVLAIIRMNVITWALIAGKSGVGYMYECELARVW